MPRIHVTPYIANDYLERDVYPATWPDACHSDGYYEVDQQTFKDMLDDADYQARWTDADRGVKQAYRHHHAKLLRVRA